MRDFVPLGDLVRALEPSRETTQAPVSCDLNEASFIDFAQRLADKGDRAEVLIAAQDYRYACAELRARGLDIVMVVAPPPLVPAWHWGVLGARYAIWTQGS